MKRVDLYNRIEDKLDKLYDDQKMYKLGIDEVLHKFDSNPDIAYNILITKIMCYQEMIEGLRKITSL